MISLFLTNLIIALINDSINNFLTNKECKKYRLANLLILESEISYPQIGYDDPTHFHVLTFKKEPKILYDENGKKVT